MALSATAKAQALVQLEEAAQVCKRMERLAHTALQQVRRSQAVVTGIELEPTHPEGGTVNGNQDTLKTAS